LRAAWLRVWIAGLIGSAVIGWPALVACAQWLVGAVA
jgi:hypothetical protein